MAKTSSKTRRPRNSLSRESILDAAEGVASAEGYEALTVRAVAAELDAAPMALYRHVATKNDLVNELLNRVLGRFEPAPESGDWRQDLRGFARAHRRLLAEHPWAITPLFSHPSPGLNATRIGEHALGILRRAGLSDEDAVATFSGVLALNYGWSAFAAARESAAAEEVATAMEALSAEEYPLTAAVAGEMRNYASDSHYGLVLEQLVSGVRP
jgi:AcrR family transcriptional regulator